MGSEEHRLRFFRTLASMQGAGLPLTRALQTFDCEKDALLHQVCQTILAEVLKGRKLSEGMRLCVGVFSAYHLATVEVGEAQGRTDVALEALAQAEERRLTLRLKILHSLTMPALMLALVVVLMVLFLPGFVFPAYLQLIVGLNLDATGWFGICILWMQWTQSWKFWVPALGSLALLTMILCRERQREIFFRSWLRAFASVPGWGQYFQAVYHSGSSWQGLLAGLEAVILTGPLSASLGRTLVYARTSSFSAALAAQLRSGSTLAKAIRPAAEASGSLLAQLHHKTILQHLQEGLPLYAALAIPGIFPPLFIQGMKVGEESGKLPEMCQKCSDVLSMEVEHSLESTLALLEPLVVAFLGVVMAFLALLMLGPLVKVVEAL